MVKRICDNCTQKETCHLLKTLEDNGQLREFFTGDYCAGLTILMTSDLALACKFYEEEK